MLVCLDDDLLLVTRVITAVAFSMVSTTSTENEEDGRKFFRFEVLEATLVAELAFLFREVRRPTIRTSMIGHVAPVSVGSRWIEHPTLVAFKNDGERFQFKETVDPSITEEFE